MENTSRQEGPSEELEMQLHNLRVFIAVAEATSIAGAVDLLYKAPSAISRSILELERAIGLPLFERKPRGMLINEYGKAVLTRANRIKAEIEAAAAEVTAQQPSSSSQSVITSHLFNSRRLQLIISLAFTRSLSATAAELDITSAGASMALNRIEAVIGEALFEKKMPGLVASDIAANLVVRAKRVFAELRHVQSDLSSISGNLGGSVVIGALPLGRTRLIPRALTAALAACPGIHITTIDSPYDQLVQGLRNGDIDIVVGVLRPGDIAQGLTHETLFADELCIVVRADHPLATHRYIEVEDLMAVKWILPRRTTLAKTMSDAFFKGHGIKPPTPSVETGDLATIREMLLSSDMLAVTPRHQLLFEIENKFLVELPVKLAGTDRMVELILRDGALLSPAGQRVLAEVRIQVNQKNSRV